MGEVEMGELNKEGDDKKLWEHGKRMLKLGSFSGVIWKTNTVEAF